MTDQNQNQLIKIATLLEQQMLFNQQNEKRFAEDRELNREDRELNREYRELMLSKFAGLSEDNRLIREDNRLINEKLDRIERNTIIIKNIVITDFKDISEETKSEIQETGELAVEQYEQMGYQKFVKGDGILYMSPGSKKTILGQSISTTNIIKQTPNHTLAAIPTGNYLSGIFNKLVNNRFNGGFPLIFMPLINSILYYHNNERNSYRKN
jgi:hypothetical protein